MKHHPHGKGFKQQHDARDANFPLRALLKAAPDTKNLLSKVWRAGPVLDQGQTSSCVGHGCFQLCKSEPWVQQMTLTPFDIYHQAQLIDEYPGEGDGTSVRAGLQVLKNIGKVQSFHWASTVDEMVHYLLSTGPLVVGTSWFAGMEQTDAAGFVHVTGGDEGGHCYLLNSVNLTDAAKPFFGGVNSWGTTFGIKGAFKILAKDFAKLLKLGGVAAAAVETPTA